MIILGIDYGSRKVGLAYSDETELIAAPLSTIFVKNDADLIAQIKTLALKKKFAKIVLGIPSGWQNVDSPQTANVKRFAELLRKEMLMSVEFWDESYSSQRAEAGARGKKRANSDSEAARIILQEYLDYQHEQTI
jgi:putative Holliday junction resolvase